VCVHQHHLNPFLVRNSAALRPRWTHTGMVRGQGAGRAVSERSCRPVRSSWVPGRHPRLPRRATANPATVAGPSVTGQRDARVFPAALTRDQVRHDRRLLGMPLRCTGVPLPVYQMRRWRPIAVTRRKWPTHLKYRRSSCPRSKAFELTRRGAGGRSPRRGSDRARTLTRVDRAPLVSHGRAPRSRVRDEQSATNRPGSVQN